jgi:hypothetical protein
LTASTAGFLLLVLVLSLNLVRINARSRRAKNRVPTLYTNLLLGFGMTAIASICLGAYVRYGGVVPSWKDRVDGQAVFAIPFFAGYALVVLLLSATAFYYLMRLFQGSQRFKKPSTKWIALFDFLLFVVLFWLCLVGG